MEQDKILMALEKLSGVNKIVSNMKGSLIPGIKRNFMEEKKLLTTPKIIKKLKIK